MALKQTSQCLMLTLKGISSFQWFNIRGEVGGTIKLMVYIIISLQNIVCLLQFLWLVAHFGCMN